MMDLSLMLWHLLLLMISKEILVDPELVQHILKVQSVEQISWT